MGKMYWIAAREYSGLAEAGGVKDVTTSLATGFSKLGWDVTVFMPFYGCTNMANIKKFRLLETYNVDISINEQLYKIKFCKGYFNGVRIIFVVHSIFTKKMGVYTYTKLEEDLYSTVKSGIGHEDASIMSILFQKAVIEYGSIVNKSPDVFHCQDAHTSLIPFLVNTDNKLKHFYENTKFFITIHNAGSAYRCQIDSTEEASELLQMPIEFFNDYVLHKKVEPFLLSQKYATFTTVSPWYADELLQKNTNNTNEFKNRLFSIIGITNGIDYEGYNPTNTNISLLPFAFNPLLEDLAGKYACREAFLQKYSTVHTETELQKIDFVHQCGIIDSGEIDTEEKPVYFAFHGRLVHQKGVDVLAKAAKIVIQKRSQARFIIMGHGEKEYENEHSELANEFYGKCIFFKGYDKALSRLVVAVSDYIVLPSFFEPCGLEDFIAQIYGTIPVAHACGGLQKIIHGKTGFLYKNNTPENLAAILMKLIDEKPLNSALIREASKHVKNEYSWEKIITENYLPLLK